MALEIEKRILLKKVPLPISAFEETHKIFQFYGPTGRLRHVIIHKNGKRAVEKFIRTKKTAIDDIVNEEVEIEITKSQFEKEVKKCKRSLNKTRYIKKYGKYKWEIDSFDFQLVIAEIEVKTKKELSTIKIPKYIKEEMIADITGDKRFSNFNLATKWK